MLSSLPDGSKEYLFDGAIRTEYQGFSKLCDFYQKCKTTYNNKIALVFEKVTFIDANMSALLAAMIKKLEKDNRIKFYFYQGTFKGDKSVLFRNGLAAMVMGGPPPTDNRDTTILLCSFDQLDADGFAEYIEEDFLGHRGLEGISYSIKNKLSTSYYELFDNVNVHAGTTEPVFVCGQYYPNQRELIFTLVDQGRGFLEKIRTKTMHSTAPITTASKAIDWAVNGNSTKDLASGGTGLVNIRKICASHKGSLHIASDNCYWGYEGGINKITTHSLINPFIGSTVQLFFKNL